MARNKRRLLVVGVGAVVVTVLEGIACGNPVAPPMSQRPLIRPDAGADAFVPSDAGVDAPDAKP